MKLDLSCTITDDREPSGYRSSRYITFSGLLPRKGDRIEYRGRVLEVVSVTWVWGPPDYTAVPCKAHLLDVGPV